MTCLVINSGHVLSRGNTVEQLRIEASARRHVAPSFPRWWKSISTLIDPVALSRPRSRFEPGRHRPGIIVEREAGDRWPATSGCSGGGSVVTPKRTTPEVIDSFTGDYAFLSNFATSTIVWEGPDYPTVEHAYQASKTLDPQVRQRIREAKSPGDARRLGRTASLRPDWERKRFHVMRQLLAQKFNTLRDLQELLLATGDAWLVEANTWGDTYWGVSDGKGANHLGLLLMELRLELRQSGHAAGVRQL